MRAAIVTCGLLDCMLPLAKYLSRRISVDLYVVVYGTTFRESVGSFDLQGLPLGVVDAAQTKEAMGATLMKYADHENLTIRLFKYPSLKVFNRQNFRLHRRLARVLNQQYYDVVHLNGYRGSQLFLYAMLRRVGKVWSVHDPILHSGEDKWQTRWAYSLFRFFRAQFILHNRQQLPEFIEKYNIKPARCHYVPLGPYEVFRLFENGQSVATEPHHVLFYGRISPYKGVEYLVEAAKIARQQLPDLHVTIAGQPNYAFDGDVSDKSLFTFIDNYIPNETLAQLIQRAAVIVCPYTDATQSGVIMTAYAFDKPVIATAVGGLPEVVEDQKTGRLVPPRDASALADALVETLSNPEELKKMQENVVVLNQSGRFSWDQIAENTLNVYQATRAVV